MHSLNALFGPNNEAGLQAGDFSIADLLNVHRIDDVWDTYFFSENGWRQVGGGDEDASGAEWPITQGMTLRRRNDEPLDIVIDGVPIASATTFTVGQGPHYYNNIYGEDLTLAEFDLRSVGDQFLVFNDGGVVSQTWTLIAPNQWENALGETKGGGEIPVSPRFGIERLSLPRLHTVSPPAALAPVLRPRPFLALSEDAIRTFHGLNMSPVESLCLYLATAEGRHGADPWNAGG